MAKPIKVYDSDRASVKEDVQKSTIDILKKSSYNVQSDTVSIRSLIDANMKVTGAVTGNIYVFSGSGAIQDVDSQDANELLNKKRGRSCCGGQSGKHLFEVVQG